MIDGAEIREEVAGSTRAFVDSFRSPNVARAQLGLVSFSLTEWAAYIAMVVYAYADGGAAMVGIISAIQLVPAALLAPVGSTLGDRHRRDRVLMWSYASLVVATAATGAAILAGAPTFVVYAASAVAAWLVPLIRPAHGALLPWVARTPAELTVAYAASGVIESASVLVGPLIASAILAIGQGVEASGPGLVLATLAVLLGLGTLAVAGIDASPEVEPPAERPSIRADVLDGISTVWRDPRPRRVVAFVGPGWITVGIVDTLIVVLAYEFLTTGDAGVGLLNAAIGVGAVVGSLVAVVATARRVLFPVFRAGIVLAGLPIAIVAAAPAALAAPGLAVAGFGGTLTDTTGTVMLQRLVPDRKLTRVFGVLESVYMGGEGIGAIVGATLVLTAGPRWTLAVAGLLAPVVGFLLRHRIAELDVGVRVPDEEMAVLGATEIFGPLPGPALERIARNAVPLAVPAGEAVVVEGDVGDRFYVIEQGSVEVSKEGRRVETLEPGGFFGEIALLRDIPRTATVTAITDLRLLALDRDEFLGAMTGHAASRGAAQEVAEERLKGLGAGADGQGRRAAPAEPPAPDPEIR